MSKLLSLLGIEKYLTAAKIIILLLAVRRWLVEIGVLKPIFDTTPVLPPHHPDRKTELDDRASRNEF